MNKRIDYALESPFDPKWEMTPEQIAKVFANNKDNISGPKGEATPELSAENNKNQVDTTDSQDRFYKLLLDQNYLALITSIQSRLNKLYDNCDSSTTEVNKDFLDQIVALKAIRANANSLYNLALKSKSIADVVAAKDILIELAKTYH